MKNTVDLDQAAPEILIRLPLEEQSDLGLLHYMPRPVCIFLNLQCCLHLLEEFLHCKSTMFLVSTLFLWYL